MATPMLIDTDMGCDDALAVALALMAPGCDVGAIVSVGGNVSIDQATLNIGRLLGAIAPPAWPMVGRGLDQSDPTLVDARDVFSRDGFGGAAIPEYQGLEIRDYRAVYREMIERHSGALHVVAIGPLTNLAALLAEAPGLLKNIARLTVMGGAVFAKGNVTPWAEFNFYRDPAAAAVVMGSGLPITLAPDRKSVV